MAPSPQNAAAEASGEGQKKEVLGDPRVERRVEVQDDESGPPESSGVSSDEEGVAPEASRRKVRMGKMKEDKKEKKKQLKNQREKIGEGTEGVGGKPVCPKSEDVTEDCNGDSDAPVVPWEHDKQNPITKPEPIEYCPICGLPPEYCEFGESWDECRPWVLEHYPELYPDLAPEVATADKVGDAAVDAKGDSAAKGKSGGGKKKLKPVVMQVTIQRVSRAKRKTATVVAGLDLFGVKLDKAAKLFSKQFACGASVIKGIPGQADQIEIQGDIEDTLGEFLTNVFPEITLDKLVFLRPK